MDHFELLKNKTAVFTDRAHRVNEDPVLLCEFARLKRGARVLDVGCGCGIIPLFLADAGHEGEIFAIDTDLGALALFERSIEAARFGNIKILNADANVFSQSEKFDAVFCNPPYFSSGEISADKTLANARHDGTLDICGVCRAAARNLKQGGSLYVCYPSASFAALTLALCENKLEPKRARFVRHETKDEAYLALVEAVYRGGRGLKLEAELTVS